MEEDWILEHPRSESAHHPTLRQTAAFPAVRGHEKKVDPAKSLSCSIVNGSTTPQACLFTFRDLQEDIDWFPSCWIVNEAGPASKTGIFAPNIIFLSSFHQST